MEKDFIVTTHSHSCNPFVFLRTNLLFFFGFCFCVIFTCCNIIGHDHVDEWFLTRAEKCELPREWDVTGNVVHCNGGNSLGDLAVGNLFGFGNSSLACAYLPPDQAANTSLCQAACSGNDQCAGLTFIPQGLQQAQCCFARNAAVVQLGGKNTCFHRRAFPWQETSGIKWCSGGTNNFPVYDAFGGGFVPGEPHCALVPANVTTEEATILHMCQDYCTFGLPNATLCAGFTFYPPNECCFRQNTTSKPPDPAATARCYEKQCHRPPTGVVLVGPSLTEGFPAANPAMRMYTVNASDHTLLDSVTFVMDLHTANAEGQAAWQPEYSLKSFFDLPDLSPASFATALAGMVPADSLTWRYYRGQGSATLYLKNYTGPSALPCNGTCQIGWLAVMNDTVTEGQSIYSKATSRNSII